MFSNWTEQLKFVSQPLGIYRVAIGKRSKKAMVLVFVTIPVRSFITSSCTF